MRTTARRLTAGAAALGLAAVLAGCGGSSGAAGAANPPPEPASSAQGSSGQGSSGQNFSAPGTTATSEAPSPPSSGPVVPTPVMVDGRAVQYHGEKQVSGQSRVELTMEDFFFSPTVLVGSPGQKLTLDVKNAGRVDHTFTVADQGIDKVLKGGESAMVTVTFPSSGQVPFVCTYHSSAGMAGVLAVR